MKHSATVSIVLCCLLFLLPLVVTLVPRIGEGEEEITQIEKLPPGQQDAATTLRVLVGDTVEEMTLGDYLQGVLRAEMPASFEEEALKAQAVAARTYTLYKIETGGNHGTEADICTDSTCCQAYLSAEKARQPTGETRRSSTRPRSTTPWPDTDGETILYNGVSHPGGVPLLLGGHDPQLRGGLDQRPALSPERGGHGGPGDAIPNYYSTRGIHRPGVQGTLSGQTSGGRPVRGCVRLDLAPSRRLRRPAMWTTVHRGRRHRPGHGAAQHPLPALSLL